MTLSYTFINTINAIGIKSLWFLIPIGAIPITINYNRVRAGLSEYGLLGVMHTIVAIIIGLIIIIQAPIYAINFKVYSEARRHMNYQMDDVSKYIISPHQMVGYVEPDFDKNENKYSFYDNKNNIASISSPSEMEMIEKVNNEVFDHIKESNYHFLNQKRKSSILGIIKIPYTINEVMNVKFSENKNKNPRLTYEIKRKFTWLMGY